MEICLVQQLKIHVTHRYARSNAYYNFVVHGLTYMDIVCILYELLEILCRLWIIKSRGAKSKPYQLQVVHFG